MQGAIVGYKMRNASLSARRAWIEIAGCWRDARRVLGRSPQGERG